MSEKQLKIGFVMPWYGENAPGGAESEARRTMKRLAAAGYDVEVLTTCIRDFHANWSRNYYRAGVSEEGGLAVRRFPVKRRNKPLFDRINFKFMNRQAVTAEEEVAWLDNLFICPELYRYMGAHAADYIFFFIPYMFPSTVYGCQIAPERSVVVPCLHDEGYLYSRTQKIALAKPRVLLFHARSEMRLAELVAGDVPGQERLVIGGGIETDLAFEPDGARFRQKYDLVDRPFVIYVGRKEETKNVPLLLKHWQAYIEKTGSSAELIFMGPDELRIPDVLKGSVRDLGFVSLQDKWDGYAAADVLCQPSVNESFSIVMMESWVAGTPVLVNGHCAVTREFCVEAQGGLYFTNKEEFAGALEYLWSRPEVGAQMGRNGRVFVEKNYRWDVVLAHYEAVIGRLQSELGA